MLKAQKNINQSFFDACKRGSLKQVKYCLTSPDLTHKADIHYKEDSGFIEACIGGHLEVVRFLLTSNTLSEHPDIQIKKNLAIRMAAQFGSFELVEYLTSSTELKIHANHKVKNDEPFAWACRNYDDSLKIIDYLLSSPKLKTYADIHAHNDVAMEYALKSVERGSYEFVKFLIIDKNIYFNSTIKYQLNEFKKHSPDDYQLIDSLIEKRKLFKTMNKNLEETGKTDKSFKL